MASILVDYENVNGSNGLKGADALCADDTLIIFYSNCCGKIRCDYLQNIKDSGCEFRVVKLKGSGKNALDFYIECLLPLYSALFYKKCVQNLLNLLYWKGKRVPGLWRHQSL